MHKKNRNYIVFALLVCLAFSLTVNVNLMKKSTYTAEVAKVISINRDQTTIIIRNLGGQERLVKVKAVDSEVLQLDTTYWLEYKSNFGETPRLVSYKLLKFDE
jgi:hypothetical protein